MVHVDDIDTGSDDVLHGGLQILKCPLDPIQYVYRLSVGIADSMYNSLLVRGCRTAHMNGLADTYGPCIAKLIPPDGPCRHTATPHRSLLPTTSTPATEGYFSLFAVLHKGFGRE